MNHEFSSSAVQKAVTSRHQDNQRNCIQMVQMNSSVGSEGQIFQLFLLGWGFYFPSALITVFMMHKMLLMKQLLDWQVFLAQPHKGTVDGGKSLCECSYKGTRGLQTTTFSSTLELQIQPSWLYLNLQITCPGMSLTRSSHTGSHREGKITFLIIDGKQILEKTICIF